MYYLTPKQTKELKKLVEITISTFFGLHKFRCTLEHLIQLYNLENSALSYVEAGNIRLNWRNAPFSITQNKTFKPLASCQIFDNEVDLKVFPLTEIIGADIITYFEEEISVYDLTVDTYNNFAINIENNVGLFVHNSYHPHGNSAIYGTLVNMVHDRYPLVEGYGNFGNSVDSPAAERYTLCRLTPLSMEVMKDTEVAEYVDNYSGDRKEPLVLASRAPMLLLNGSEGIGVALSACIPPHNLTEVVKSLIFLIRNPTCRLDSILNYIQGPDYGTGVLVSSQEDVKNLYETGKGTLSYRCKYHFDEDEGNSLLVITDLAPCFNLGNFLTKMKGLQDQGLIDYCSNVSNSEGMKIIIGFSDPSVLMERVVSELTVSESYQFYVVKRTDKELLSNDTLFQCNLKELLQHFIAFRRDIEGKRIRLELQKEKEKLVKAEAILLGIKKLDVLYPILHSNKYSTIEELSKSVSKALNCTIDQSKIILELKLQQLSRMNEKDQEKKINSIEEELKVLKNDLNNIDEVVIKHLKELPQFESGIRTEIRIKEPKLKFDTSDTVKWIINNGKKVVRLNEEPNKKLVYESITTCNRYVTVICEDNTAHVLWSSYFTENKFKSNVVNVIGDNCEKLVVLDDKGSIAVIEQPQKKNVYQLIKGAIKIVNAVGLSTTDSLVIVNDKKDGKILVGEELEATRTFVYGKNLLRNSAQIYRLGCDSELFNTSGETLKIGKDNTFDAKNGVLIVGDKNLISIEDKKIVVNKEEMFELLKNNKIESCVSVSKDY